jgi:hypothetical protein
MSVVATRFVSPSVWTGCLDVDRPQTSDLKSEVPIVAGVSNHYKAGRKAVVVNRLAAFYARSAIC